MEHGTRGLALEDVRREDAGRGDARTRGDGDTGPQERGDVRGENVGTRGLEDVINQHLISGLNL